MNRIMAALLAATTIIAAAPASAQGHAATIRAGTPIELRTSEALDSGNHVGTRFHLEVASPVTRDGKVLIPAGSIATGEVVTVRDHDEPGKTSRIVARLVSVQVGPRTIRLAGGVDDAGTSLVGVIPTGTVARGFVDENVAFEEPRPLPAPMAKPPVQMAAIEASPAPLPGMPARVEARGTLPAGVTRQPRIAVPPQGRPTGPHIVAPRPPVEMTSVGDTRPGLSLSYLENADPAPRRGIDVVTPSVVRVHATGPARARPAVARSSRTNVEYSAGGVTTHYVY